MAQQTKIEWCDDSANLWVGCAKVHHGCSNCYAESFQRRFGTPWGPNKPRIYSKTWSQTLHKLARIAEREGRRRTVFINSHSDFFEDNTLPLVDREGRELYRKQDGTIGHTGVLGGADTDPLLRSELTVGDVRRMAFEQFDRLSRWLTFILVTKRPENVWRMWPAVSISTQQHADNYNERGELYRSNVWLLTSISDQASADKQIPELLNCRDLSPVLGLSCEPLLKAIDLRFGDSEGLPTNTHPFRERGDLIDWVIVGGESGPGARPMHPEWSRSLRDQCAAAGVPFFFKQWGEYAPVAGAGLYLDQWARRRETLGMVTLDGKFNPDKAATLGKGREPMARVGKKAAGRLLDGVENNGVPEYQRSPHGGAALSGEPSR